MTGANALLIILLWRRDAFNVISMFVFTLFPVIMTLLSRYFRARGWKGWWYPLTIAAAGLIAGLAVFIISPAYIRGMFDLIGFIFIPNIATTNMEMQPLLFTLGRFTWDGVMESFPTVFFISLVAICVVIYKTAKSGVRHSVLLIIWSLFTLWTAFSMRRFAYYYAVNASLLAGCLCWMVLNLAGFGKSTKPEQAEAVQRITKKAKKRKAAVKRGRRSTAPALAYKTLSVIGILFIVFYPNFGPLPGGAKPISDMASQPSFAPSDGWCDALVWLRKNSPEPLGNAEAYYKLWEKPAGGAEFQYPDGAYSVLAWWEYGYLITRIGRRIPMTNPGMGAEQENQYSSFFMADDENQARRILETGGGQYVMIDFDTALPLKFYSVAASAGSSKEKYYDVYFRKQGGTLTPIIFFIPNIIAL